MLIHLVACVCQQTEWQWVGGKSGLRGLCYCGHEEVTIDHAWIMWFAVGTSVPCSYRVLAGTLIGPVPWS